MAARNTPNLGQKSPGKSSGSSRVIPQGQGVTQRTKGGPPASLVSRNAVGGKGSTTLNTQPVKGGGK